MTVTARAVAAALGRVDVDAVIRRALAGTKYSEDQPREPAGSEDGGQWTSGGAASAGAEGTGGADVAERKPSTPRMSKYSASIAGPVISNAGLHPLMLDKLSRIKVEPTRLVTEKAVGLYWGPTRGVQVAAHAYVSSGASGGATAQDVSNVLLHEIGHHVHMAKMTPKAARTWSVISNFAMSARVTAYATTNAGEHFAEAFMAYHSGPTWRHRLESREPAAYAFIAGLGEKDLMKAGRKAGDRTRMERLAGRKAAAPAVAGGAR